MRSGASGGQVKGTYHDYEMSSLELDRVQIVQLGGGGVKEMQRYRGL